VADLTGPIAPISARYCTRVIGIAGENRANALIIMLDTPGGDYDTTQDIVTAISNSRVPVVVFVAPAGGWAGSAGTFITLSANVAAMAPGSRIGAAHPVIEGNPIMSPTDTEQNIPYEKITEDASAWIRSLAEVHGRNPVAAEQAVRESKSFSDTEALEQHLIDLRAKDLPDLLSQLQGRTVTLASGARVQLQTLDAPVVNLPMSSLEQLLLILSDPNLAYLLLIIGMAGLMVEIYHPGLILPGVVGGVAMLLGLYALGTLNAYWGGIMLIILAFGFFVAEAFTFTHGALGAGGVISLVIGSLLLFSNQPYGPRVSVWLIAGTALVFILLLALLITLVMRAQRQPVRTGKESMLGERAVARTELHPDGTVFVSGELWNASSESGNIPGGTEVVITGVDGLRLRVRRK
jgi:membrane-bound serine protease (ClpP class)